MALTAKERMERSRAKKRGEVVEELPRGPVPGSLPVARSDAFRAMETRLGTVEDLLRRVLAVVKGLEEASQGVDRGTRQFRASTRSSEAAPPMVTNNAMDAFLATQPHVRMETVNHETGEVRKPVWTGDEPPTHVPVRRQFQGRDPRECCDSYPGFEHRDTCREVGSA